MGMKREREILSPSCFVVFVFVFVFITVGYIRVGPVRAFEAGLVLVCPRVTGGRPLLISKPDACCLAVCPLLRLVSPSLGPLMWVGVPLSVPLVPPSVAHVVGGVSVPLPAARVCTSGCSGFCPHRGSLVPGRAVLCPVALLPIVLERAA